MTLPTVLHYYRCRNCHTVMICAIKKPTGYEACNGCRSYMKFLFTEPVETPEQRDAAALVAKLGKVYRVSPAAEPLAYTPSTRESLPYPTPEEGRRLSQEDRNRIHQLEQEQERLREAAFIKLDS